MDEPSKIVERFRESPPGRLVQRRERRTLRRLSFITLILAAVVVGATIHLTDGLAAILLSVGRSLVGLAGLGLVGMMVGVMPLLWVA
jgi:hypothetical protein